MPLALVRRLAPALIVCSLMAACGSTYDLPGVNEDATRRASILFSEAQAAPPRSAASARAGEERFNRVARRVQPVAEQLCRQELATNKQVDCKVALELDREMTERNAYFTYTKPGNKSPVIRFTMPMLQDVESDDEVAFILGHEYGHLIGQHIAKQQHQAVAGALILGAIAAYGSAQAAGAGQSHDPNAVSRSVELGAAIGQVAYSQTYELESDMLGTRIAAAAGYDPVKGARFFARSESARSEAGRLSFWGTHPPDSKRLAVVIATMAEIEGKQALARK